jgi:hypothetical protein
MEAGNAAYPEKGTPQGGVISPGLSATKSENRTLVLLNEFFPQRDRMPRTWGTKIGQVRVCGGSGEVTPRFYLTPYIDEVLPFWDIVKW